MTGDPPSGICVFFHTDFKLVQTHATPQTPTESMEKAIFGMDRNRESSPRCVRVSPQKAIFTDMDLPKMNYSPWRSLTASHWTIVHLGGFQFGDFGPLGGHTDASRGALTIPDSSKDRFLTGPWSTYRVRARNPTPPKVRDLLRFV